MAAAATTTTTAIGGGGDQEVTSSSAASSPRNRVKFMCSHGGKILPRPADGQLKYVGGETRVIVVSRDINFSELMNKLTSVFGDDNLVLKYQLIPEELDALVSVVNDRDLIYMLEEYDRHEKSSENNSGIPKLRAFLFPSTPIIIESQGTSKNTTDSQALEQRYIDAINGVVRTTSRPTFTISPSMSPPQSIDMYSMDTVNHESFALPACRSRQTGLMHRVHSSPSNLYNLSHQQHPLYHHQQQQALEHHQQPCPLPRAQAPGLSPTLSFGRNSEFGRSPMGHNPPGSSRYYYYPAPRVHRESSMVNIAHGYDGEWRS